LYLAFFVAVVTLLAAAEPIKFNCDKATSALGDAEALQVTKEYFQENTDKEKLDVNEE